jgi:hypothetical protein
MAHLWDLPIELLALVFRDLHSLDVECVARSYNKKLYSACLPLIRERIAFTKHAKYIVRVFDVHSSCDTSENHLDYS